MIPPLLIWLRVGWFRLPLPVVAAWPLLLALGILMQMLLVLPLGGGTLGRRMRIPWLLWRTLGAARGLAVDVRPAPGDGPRISIRVW